MITVRDQFVVGRPADEVWAFLEKFEELARCIPSLKSWRQEGDIIEGKVGVTLGVVPVESNVRLEITERRAPTCIEARGVSFLGETVANLRGGKEGQIRATDSGRMVLHLDLRHEAPGATRLVYAIGIEAEGRLRKIYESILKLKVPGFQREFVEKVAKALGAPASKADGDHVMCAGAEGLLAGGVVPPMREAAAAEAAAAPEAAPIVPAEAPSPGPSFWYRLTAWLRRLFGRRAAA